MKPFRSRGIIYAVLLLVIFVYPHFSQSVPSRKPGTAQAAVPEYKSSAAYAEVLQRRTDLQANLESLILEYTEDYPKVKEIRFTLGLIQKETDRLAAAKSLTASQMTLALGKLIVRKIELETDVWSLLETYKPEHPDVKRAKRKVEIYESAIREILG